MAVKETYISGRHAENLFPVVSSIPISATGAPRAEGIGAFLDDFRKRQLALAEYNQLMKEFGLGGIDGASAVKAISKDGTGKEAPARRFTVNPTTGVIGIDVDDGEYTYKEAQLVSASIKGERGEFGQAIALFKAVKGEVGEGGTASKKGFYVEDSGEIVPDAENGDMSLSEARAVSASRRALVPSGDAPITKEGLELMKRDLKDEMRGSLEQEMTKLRQALTGTNKGDSESPFSVSEKGDLQIRAGAKLSVTDMVLYQNMKGQGQGPMFKDSSGSIMALPAWLEVNKFQREEARKDEMNKVVTGLFEMGRTQLPGLIAGIQNMSTSKKADEALQAGGWGKGKPGAKTADKGAAVFTSTCAGCKEPLGYTNPPCIVTCRKCGGINMYGTPEEQKVLMEQLIASTQQVKKDGGSPAEQPEV